MRVQVSPRPRRWPWVSGLVLLLVIGVAVAAPWLAPHDPLQVNVGHRLQPPGWVGSGAAGGTEARPETHPRVKTRADVHWFGTDELGRDVLSRLVYGARTSLAVSGLAVTVGAVLGSVLGLVAGYRRGLLDGLLGRIADIQQALPFIVLVLAVAAVSGPSFVNVVLVLGVGSWVVHYRTVRAVTMSIAQRPYVEAAHALGQTDVGVIGRHVLPNVLPVIIVNVTTFVPQLMLFEAALSFLGLGVPPPTPTWGGMIAAGRGYVEVAWWMSVFPGLILMATVAAIHGLGQWLADRMDPRRQ